MTSNAPPKPRDFDWVTVRHGCTAEPMFVYLKRLAKRDVDKFNELAGAGLVTFSDNGDTSLFAVSRHRFGEKLTVVFHELGQSIMVRTPQRETELTLTLTDDADCKLVWDGTPLDPWQVLRRALEPVLFMPSR
jgi:hypothetical protein